MADNPYYEHDCKECIFLGNYYDLEYDEKYDLYFCPCYKDLVARFEGCNDYTTAAAGYMCCGTSSYIEGRSDANSTYALSEAYRRALKRGLIKE